MHLHVFFATQTKRTGPAKAMGDLGECPARQTENYFYLIYLLILINNLHNLKYSLSNVALIENTSAIVSYLL